MSVDHFRRIVENEAGVALVIALLLMLVGTAIGIFGVTSGVIETRIAGNMRLSDDNIYNADGGVHIAAVILDDITREWGNVPDLSPLYQDPFSLDLGGSQPVEQRIEIDYQNLIQEVYGPNAVTPGSNDKTPYRDPAMRNPDSALDATPDIRSSLGAQRRADIDIDRIEGKAKAGGGIEFLSGYDGIGSGGGAAGGTQIFFSFDTFGTSTSGIGIARANVEVIFRKVVNISGGS